MQTQSFGVGTIPLQTHRCTHVNTLLKVQYTVHKRLMQAHIHTDTCTQTHTINLHTRALSRSHTHTHTVYVYKHIVTKSSLTQKILIHTKSTLNKTSNYSDAHRHCTLLHTQTGKHMYVYKQCQRGPLTHVQISTERATTVLFPLT